MPSFRKQCDVAQGYDHRGDVQTPVGFVTSLTLGDLTLAADQRVSDPLAPWTELAVVAVCSGVLWELGVTDALYLTGQVSVTNRQEILPLVYQSLTTVDVVIGFAIYEYDAVAKRYFKCLAGAGDAALHGRVEKRGDDLNLSVADDPSTEVQSPANYAFQIGVAPAPSPQAIAVATSFTGKLAKAWGVAAAEGGG